jgi:hypothetical protein
MVAKLLIDTDVLIDYLRGYSKAVHYLENVRDSLLLSSITVAELYAGIKNEEEENALTPFLQLFQIISVDEKIAAMGGYLRRDYGKSHGTGLADALIAATALSHKARLITLNTRHYPMVDNAVAPYKK